MVLLLLIFELLTIVYLTVAAGARPHWRIRWLAVRLPGQSVWWSRCSCRTSLSVNAAIKPHLVWVVHFGCRIGRKHSHSFRPLKGIFTAKEYEIKERVAELDNNYSKLKLKNVLQHCTVLSSCQLATSTCYASSRFIAFLTYFTFSFIHLVVLTVLSCRNNE